MPKEQLFFELLQVAIEFRKILSKTPSAVPFVANLPQNICSVYLSSKKLRCKSEIKMLYLCCSIIIINNNLQSYGK